MTLPNGQIRTNALSNVMGVLANQNVESALAKLQSITNPDLQRNLRSMVVTSLAQKDPRRALQLAKDAGPNEQFLISSIFQQWARSNPAEARSALSTMSGPAAQQARLGLVQALAQSNPAEALRIASEGPVGNVRGMDARITAIDAWARSDPQAALTAALQIPQAQVRSNAMGAALRNWAANDFGGALKFAREIQDPALRADALVAMASNARSNSAEMFNAVTDNVPPGERFQRAMTGILNS
jgi:hypothetical protein